MKTVALVLLKDGRKQASAAYGGSVRTDGALRVAPERYETHAPDVVTKRGPADERQRDAHRPGRCWSNGSVPAQQKAERRWHSSGQAATVVSSLVPSTERRRDGNAVGSIGARGMDRFRRAAR